MLLIYLLTPAENNAFTQWMIIILVAYNASTTTHVCLCVCACLCVSVCQCVHLCVCVCIQDEVSFTAVELEKLQKTLNMSASEVDDVIGACEFIYQQVPCDQ